MSEQQQIEDLKEHLSCAMISIRQQALNTFVQELMVILAKQGEYRLDDLLDALALWSERREDWSKVTEHLDRAANEVREAKAHLIGKSKK